MKYKDCVQYLKENFVDISTDHIEQEVNLFLYKKSEKNSKPEPIEVEVEINDNEFIELLQVLANWREKEEIKKNEEIKTNQEKEMQFKGVESSIEEKTKTEKECLEWIEENNRIEAGTNREPVTEVICETQGRKDNLEEKEEEQDKLQIEIIKDIKKEEARGIEEIYCTTEAPIKNKNERESRVKINEERKVVQKEVDYIGMNKNKKMNSTIIDVNNFSESLIKQFLLSNEDIQDICQKKNFFLIDHIIVKDLSYVIEKVIVQLFEYYRENTMDTAEQLNHFRCFFRIVYTLINNIFANPNDERYRTIRFSNTQVRKNFAMNNKILNLLESLFALLNFNINYKMPDSPEHKSEEKDHAIKMSEKHKDSNKNIKNALMWKCEQSMGTKENMLFDLVLEMLRAITKILPPEKKEENKNVDKSRKLVMVESNRAPILNKGSTMRKSYANRTVMDVVSNEEKVKKQIMEVRKAYDERYKKEKSQMHNKSENIKRGTKPPKDNRIYKTNDKQLKLTCSYSEDSSSDQQTVMENKKQVWFNNLFNRDI